jgi:hypothetical protein
MFLCNAHAAHGVVTALPSLSWNSGDILVFVATCLGYAVLVLGAGIALCALVGLLFRGFARLTDIVHEMHVHGRNWKQAVLRSRRSNR